MVAIFMVVVSGLRGGSSVVFMMISLYGVMSLSRGVFSVVGLAFFLHFSVLWASNCGLDLFFCGSYFVLEHITRMVIWEF
jgi:hypothetical protein